MTKLIVVLIAAALLYAGWHLFFYWEKVRDEKESVRKEAAAAVVMGDTLPGLPYGLEQSLQAAQRQGAAGLRNWLKAYGNTVQDPRKAWIELDYVTLVSREDPSEARRVYAEVKARTAPSSPVWKRIKDLEKTYQ